MSRLFAVCGIMLRGRRFLGIMGAKVDGLILLSMSGIRCSRVFPFPDDDSCRTISHPCKAAKVWQESANHTATLPSRCSS